MRSFQTRLQPPATATGRAVVPFLMLLACTVPTARAQTATFSAAAPVVVHHPRNLLTLSLPVINDGPQTAQQVQITDIRLDNLAALTPNPLPSAAGTIAAGQTFRVTATFDTTALVGVSRAAFAGNRFRLSVHGTYTENGNPGDWAVSRFVDVPAAITPSGGPTDNPIAAAYGPSAYPWTDQVRWHNVFNVLDYGGVGDGATPNDVAFALAVDAATAGGGGVVYFPAGLYRLTDHAYLANGVVLRGQNSANNIAKSDTYQPPLAQLVFPRYVPTFTGDGTPNETAFKKIFTRAPQTDSNGGIVNLDVNRAGIKLGGDPNTASARNCIVFGARTNNAASPDNSIPRRTFTYTDAQGQTVTIPFQEGWQRWHNRFETNLRVGVYENALVANNRINDAPTDNFEQPGFLIRDSNNGTSNVPIIALNLPGQAVFRHTDHHGMVINDAPHPWYATPATAPGLFREGIVVRDNWVFHTMRNGIKANGQGLIVRDNIVQDDPNKTATIYPTGQYKPTGSVTYENRGIHVSGQNVLVENNHVRVYSHRLLNPNGTPQGYNSNDGEGLLQDNTGTVVDGWIVRGNDVNSYIGVYRPGDVRNVRIENNTTPLVWVWPNIGNGAYACTNVRIEGNRTNEIRWKQSATGSGNTIADNVAANPSGSIISLDTSTTFTGTVITGNTGFVPAKPRSLTAGDVTPTTITLFWSDISLHGVDETGYEILRNNTPLANASADQTTIILIGLTPDTDYRLTVRAFNSHGNGSASNELRVRTPRQTP